MAQMENKASSGSKRPWYLNRWLLGAVAALVVYTGAGFLLAPYLVRHYLPKIAAEQFKRQASVGEVRVNPFLLTFDARDFAFREQGGDPILGFKRLFVDFEVESLFRWAWTFADIRLEGPSVNLVVGKDDRLNLARIADELPKSEPPQRPAEPAPPPRLLLKHATLAGGVVKFTDLSNPTPASVTVEPLDLDLQNISTLPEARGPYGITAKLPGGGSVGWKGEISLHPITSSGTVRIDGFRPATAWKFFQDKLRLGEPAGEVDAEVTYRFAYASGNTALSADPIKVAVKGLALTEEGAPSPILQLASIDMPGARFDLGSREFVVPALSIRDGRVAASVDSDGTVNWANLAKMAGPAPPPAPKMESGAAPPWKVRVEALTVEGVAIRYDDASRAVPITVTAGSSRLALRAAAEAGGSDFKLVSDSIEIALEQVNGSESAGDPLLALDSITLQGGSFNLAGREMRLQRLGIAGGRIALVRRADGSLRQVEVMAPSEGGKIRRELREVREAAQAEGRPWNVVIEEGALSDFAVGYSDELTQPSIQYDLEGVNLSVKDVRNDGKTPIRYEARLDVRQGGSASASGTASLTGDAAEAEVKFDGLALKPLAPLVAKFAALNLESGDLSGTARLKYGAGKDGPSLQARGAVSVGKLLLKEADTGQRFLAWKELAAGGVDFSLGPDRLAIKEVRLREPGAKIVIFKDKSVNLAKVLKGDEAAGAKVPAEGGKPPAAKDKAAPAKAGPAAFPVAVERIRIEKGVVDFADLSLVLPFSTQIQDFHGAAMGISSNARSRASLKFEGQVGEFGEANVDGSLAPFAPKEFTDIGVAFRNVAMTPFSPYSATFAGRKIASGALDLDLQYKIENSEMLGENKVVLREFTLGEKVESPDAVNLPLDLAIALLADSEGKIDLALPVRGNVDSPEFSYGHVIWQAITNLITKIVTAPFRALGALLPGGGENLDAVAFVPGRSEISPPEKEKLKKVAEVLTKRPQLNLSAQGAYDPAVDGKAIKDRNLRLALARKLDVQVAAGEDPGPVAYDNAKTQRALEQIAEERGGKNAVDAFQAQYEKSTGKPAKRVNPVLALIGQASEDQDFYRALFAHLVEAAPKPDAELEALGEKRAAAIVQALTTAGGVDASRVSAAKPEPVEAKDKVVPARLELGVRKSGA